MSEELWNSLSGAEKEFLKRIGAVGSGNLEVTALRLGHPEPNFTNDEMQTLEQLEFRRLITIGRSWKPDELTMRAFLTKVGQTLLEHHAGRLRTISPKHAGRA